MILCSWEPNCKDKYVFSQGRGPSFSSSSSPSHTLSMEQLSAEHLALWWSGDLSIWWSLAIYCDLVIWWSLVISGDLVIWWSLVIQVSASSLSQSWGDEEKIEPTCRQEIALFPTLVDCWWWETGEARPHHQPHYPPPSLKGGARPWTSTVTKDPNLDWIALVAVTTILIPL